MMRYEKYKPSGVAWIGEIPEHWELKKIKYLFKDHAGNGFPEAHQGKADGDFPFYKVSDINQKGIYVTKSNNYVSREEVIEQGWNIIPQYSILAAKIGEALKKNHRKINSAECIIDNNCIALSPVYLEREYAYCLLTIINFGWFTNPGAVPSVSNEKLKNFFVLQPTKSEQIAIANFINEKTVKIDTLIANKQKLIKLLTEERAAVINQAVTRGIDPNVQLKPSGIEWLGDIPKHWDVKKLKYLANLKSGESITSDLIKEDEIYPVYGGNGLRGFASKYTHDGDYILIGRQGALCGNINYANGKFWASEHAIVVTRLNKENILWLGELLKSMNLNQHSISAAQPGLAVERIQNLYIPYPPKDEQPLIGEYINQESARINGTISKIEKEIELLQEYRTALISEVVTGKIKVI
jgi:type I restriction enzyme, S subunit